MQNSFIIKNADESFDQYYTQMKRRRLHAGNQSVYNHTTSNHLDASMLSQSAAEGKYGLVMGKKPTARDGHTATVDSHGFMYVFGGDRHHMPFNDLYMIKLYQHTSK